MTHLPLFIHQQAAIQLTIHDWKPIPVPKRLRLVMKWIYKPRLLQYFGGNRRVLIELQYDHQFEWMDSNPLTKDAQAKLGPAKSNGVLDDIESLVKQHAPLFSPLAGMSEIMPGLLFPFTHPIPPLQFTTISLSPNEDLTYPPCMEVKEGEE